MISRPFIFISIIIIVVAVLVAVKCCTGPRPIVQPIEQAAVKQAVDSVRALQSRIDSVIILRKDKVIDSLAPLAAQAHVLVNEKGRQIAGTIAAGQLARIQHDTVKILANCDSLVEQVKAGAQLVGSYEVITDSLVAAMQEQRRIQDSLTRLSQLQARILRRALDSAMVTYQRLSDENIRLDKIAHKRWSVGPGGGAVLIDGQVRFTVGISVHYNLFTF